MQTNAHEQARVETALREAAEAHAMRLVASRLTHARPDSLLQTTHGVVQALFCLAVGLAMTTIAINGLLRWLGW